MKDEEKRIIINIINEIIDSRSSKFSKADLEKLIVAREKVANAKHRKTLIEALKDIYKFYKDI